MLSTGCPGIVLYGRRRTGKSTILRNLRGFLPPSVITVNISMEHPEFSTSLALFLKSIVHAIQDVLPGGSRVDETPVNLPTFFRLLEKWNGQLVPQGKRLLLAVDEYENIDRKIGQSVFSEDLLATLRESIQSHRHLTWVFAGSHEITELSNAAWTSYLVSARTVEVPFFTPAETRLLLTEPLKHSSLWPTAARQRPSFTAEFWGDGGIERIHLEAGGWPHLVQLIAETTVDLMNDEQARQLDEALLEQVLDKAIVRGHNVLYELMRRESFIPGEWEYLAAFRTHTSQPPPEEEAIRQSLRRRSLVAERDGEWRLRVPLMARWLRERG